MLAVPWARGQQTSKVTLDTSETIFSVVTAMNICGYDQELGTSDAARAQVRTEVAQAVQSERAQAVVREMCAFYRDHQQADSGRDLAQYVSLALNLGEPPGFAAAVKEADLPPDAAYVLGFVPLLQRFYINADLHRIWVRHNAEYESLIDSFHKPIADMLLATDTYLRMPISGYVGRRFVIFLEPMTGPGQVNARNYGADYFMVVAPERGQLRLAAIRHTYLHFVLDPLVGKRGSTLQRLEPLMETVKTAPMDEAFKSDVTLLVTESVIRAIEARTSITGKTKQAEAEREHLTQRAAEEGFVLAPYFEQQLAKFEKAPESFQDSFPNWLHDIDVASEKKRAARIVFALSATPESMHAAPPKPVSLLDQAEKRLAAGEVGRARELAQQALDEKRGEPARALFILARVATLSKDMPNAKAYFERALAAGADPQVLAWSHIYLGRIYDLKEERAAALEHYRAALAAGDASPATRAAAERGLQQPYAPPAARAPQEQKQD